MLLRQYNFPSSTWAGDRVAEFWSDQIGLEPWRKAVAALRERGHQGMCVIDDATDRSFLQMAQSLVGKDFKATGAIAVGFTNPATSRLLVRLTVVGVYKGHRELYNGNTGPHVAERRLPHSLSETPHLAAAWGNLVSMVSAAPQRPPAPVSVEESESHLVYA